MQQPQEFLDGQIRDPGDLSVSFYSRRKNTTKYLPDLSKARQANLSKKAEEMAFAGSPTDTLGQEYLDAEDLESEFYRGLKQDIDQILLKAWDGDS